MNLALRAGKRNRLVSELIGAARGFEMVRRGTPTKGQLINRPRI